MHIGLIGGIGPAATVAYYNRLVHRFRSVEVPWNLTIVHADVSILIANSASDRRAAQAEIFAGHIRQLHGAGCDVAAITALTGHFCFDEVQQLATLPLVSAITPIDQFCHDEGLKTIGLLGSPPVMTSHLFGQMPQTRTVIPEANIEDLGQAYLEMASTGVCSEKHRQQFFASGSEMIRNQRADAVLLAGTDLGLAFDGRDPGYRIINALEIHVDALVELARGGTI